MFNYVQIPIAIDHTNAKIPRSWHSPAICTQRTSLAVIFNFGCRAFNAVASCPAKWQTLKKKIYQYKLPVCDILIYFELFPKILT